MSNSSNSERPIWRPYTQERIASPALALERAEGAYLFTANGAKIFDGISSWWLITHGHCHPAIVDAVKRQAERLDQVTFANFTHEPAEELAALLLEVAPPRLKKVFFSDNGSTAVEVALKMTLQACAQSGHPEKTRFLAFEAAYHGDTVGAMSVSGESPYNQPYRSTLFDVIRVKHPTRSDRPTAEWLTDFEARIEAHRSTLAGVIVEPLVQGAGGMIVWPEDAVRRVAQICRENGIFLIFDEVMTGFGRTGRMFASEKLGVTPDVLCVSKGLTGGMLPLSATLATQDIFDAFFSAEKKHMFFHGHSFTGNPISCAAAAASLKLFRTEGFWGRMERLEMTQRQELHRLAQKLEISDARVCGTIAAFEFQGHAKGYLEGHHDRRARAALENGLFIRPMGNTFYLMPYGATSADLGNAWTVLGDVLSCE